VVLRGYNSRTKHTSTKEATRDASLSMRNGRDAFYFTALCRNLEGT